MQWAKQKGFTIVELLIVVVVIAILAAITIVAYTGIQNRAKASAAQSTASQVAKKIALWQVDNAGQTPTQADVNTFTSTISGTTFQYTPMSNGAYCMTATTNSISYYFTNAAATPIAGACFGHNLNGATFITNLISNPSFESNTDGWTSSGNSSLSYPTTGGGNGPRYYSISRTATAAIGLYSPQFDVTVGDTYTGSLNVRFATGRQAFLRYRWYDATNTEIGSTANTVASGTGSWQRIAYSLAAPSGAVSGRLDVVMNTTGAVVGDTLDIDGAMVTKGGTTYTYADGNSSGWSWQGTANNSPSSGTPL